MKVSVQIVGLVLVLGLGGASAAAAQDRVKEAQALYEGAMYGQALDLFEQIARERPTADIHHFRALCLIALGRADAAERAMADAVAADPFYKPDAETTSPRVMATFDGVRRRLLAPMIRRNMADATTLYRDGAKARASERFVEVLKLLEDPILKGDQSLADLSLAAAAFVELTKAQTAATPAAPTPAAPVVANTAPATVPSPLAAAAAARTPPSPAAAAAAAPVTPAAASTPMPSATPAAASTVRSVPTTSVFEPAVALVRPLPRWNPRDVRTASRGYSGSVLLVVDEKGAVIAASTKRTIHPSYDPIVLEAARSWVYKPATQNGKPVRSEVTVDIELKPSAN